MPNSFQNKSSGAAELKDFYEGKSPRSQLAALLRRKRRKRAKKRGIDPQEYTEEI